MRRVGRGEGEPGVEGGMEGRWVGGWQEDRVGWRYRTMEKKNEHTRSFVECASINSDFACSDCSACIARLVGTIPASVPLTSIIYYPSIPPSSPSVLTGVSASLPSSHPLHTLLSSLVLLHGRSLVAAVVAALAGLSAAARVRGRAKGRFKVSQAATRVRGRAKGRFKVSQAATRVRGLTEGCVCAEASGWQSQHDGNTQNAQYSFMKATRRMLSIHSGRQHAECSVFIHEGNTQNAQYSFMKATCRMLSIYS